MADHAWEARARLLRRLEATDQAEELTVPVADLRQLLEGTALQVPDWRDDEVVVLAWLWHVVTSRSPTVMRRALLWALERLEEERNDLAGPLLTEGPRA